ncbi:50S ribosomal protein L7Ae [Candidatus Marsarchaeota archaeon]|nr:50S ribosomal protein L7Ae [Candidatus Marsarchaeota archaeon]
MAKSYVKFEVSKDVVAKTYEALQLAKQSGKVKKGVNEVTKSVERGLASFVVMAEDIEPEEIMAHIPSICEQKKIAYSYVPTKQELGKSIGMNVPCSAIAVEDQGSASNSIKDVISKITGTSQKQAPKKEENKVEKKEEKKEEPKKEAKKEEAKEEGASA